MDRFDQLTSHFHFTHVEEEAPLQQDRMWKFRSVVESLNDPFQSTFVLEQDIATNELWKFRRRLAFETSKRVRFGLKVHKLCVSSGPV